MSFPSETQLQEWLQYAMEAGYPMKSLPAGAGPTFNSRHKTASQLYMTAGVCIPLIAIFGSFRLLYAIKLKRKILIADEITFGLGFGLCFAFVAMTLAAVNHYGYLGQHAWDNSFAEAIHRTITLAVLVQTFAPLAICAVKVCALTLYLRVYGGSLLWLRVTCMVSIILLVVYHISLATAFGVMCVSDQLQRARTLILPLVLGNGLFDLVVLFLPLPVVSTPFRKLQNSTWQEFKMLAVSLIGALCVPTNLSFILVLLFS